MSIVSDKKTFAPLALTVLPAVSCHAHICDEGHNWINPNFTIAKFGFKASSKRAIAAWENLAPLQNPG